MRLGRSLWILGSCGISFLAGCGGDEAGGASGSPGGGGPGGGDSGTGGAGGHAVVGERVLVRSPRGAPVADLDVIVHDASGAVVAEAKTGSDGSAPISLPEGGGVSLLWVEASTSDPGLRVASFLGLEPGAELRVVVDRQPDPPLGGLMHLELDVPQTLSAGDWNVEVSCYGESNLGELGISYAGCPDSSTFDVLVYYGDSDQWGKRQVFAGETFVPGATRTYTLDPALAEAAPRIDVIGAGLPADADWFSAGITATRPEGGDNSTGQSTSPQSSAGPVNRIRRPWVSEGGTFDLFTTAGVLGDWLVDRRLPLDALPDSVTWTPTPLARVELVGPFAGTPSRPEVSWSLSGDAPLGQVVGVTLSYHVADLESGYPLTDAVTWSLAAPATAHGKVSFPALPERFAGWLQPDGYIDGVGVAHQAASGGMLGAMNAEYDRKELTRTLAGVANVTLGP